MHALYGQMVRFALLVNVVVAVMTVAATVRAAETVRIVAFGDSLTAGYGLKPDESFPARLEKSLKSRGHAVEVVNSGVSGDTTSAARERLDWAVPAGTHAVILELGANDALRGLPVERARTNLDAILEGLRKRGVEVLLAGMRAPRNLGDTYANAFDAIFSDLASKHGVLHYPFFLAGVALDPKLNLADGLHPNAAGIEVITQRILPDVEKLIARVRAKRS